MLNSRYSVPTNTVNQSVELIPDGNQSNETGNWRIRIDSSGNLVTEKKRQATGTWDEAKHIEG